MSLKVASNHTGLSSKKDIRYCCRTFTWMEHLFKPAWKMMRHHVILKEVTTQSNNKTNFWSLGIDYENAMMMMALCAFSMLVHLHAAIPVLCHVIHFQLDIRTSLNHNLIFASSGSFWCCQLINKSANTSFECTQHNWSSTDNTSFSLAIICQRMYAKNCLVINAVKFHTTGKSCINQAAFLLLHHY